MAVVVAIALQAAGVRLCAQQDSVVLSDKHARIEALSWRSTPRYRSETQSENVHRRTGNVEDHLSHGGQTAGRHGLQGYELEKLEDGKLIWHLRRNPTEKKKNVLTIGIYDGQIV